MRRAATNLRNECGKLHRVRMARHKLPPQVQEYFDVLFNQHDDRSDLGEGWLADVVGAMDDVSTLSAARALLFERGLHYSAGSWVDFKEKRIEPALEQDDLDRSNVLEMLQDMEEHGKMHVLLFSLQPGKSVSQALRPSAVSKALSAMKLGKALNSLPPTVGPVKTKVTHVRLEVDGSLVVKALETKETFRQIDDIPLHAGREIRLARRKRARRVKVARLYPDGLLEIRLGSTKPDPNEGSRHDYGSEASQFMSQITPLVPSGLFRPQPLDVFKSNLWKRSGKGAQADILVLSQTLKSDEGNELALRAGDGEKDASSDKALRAASLSFLQEKGSSMAQAKILWLAQARPGRPNINYTVRFTREPNEFLTTRATTEADYDHVFSDIRRLGKF